MTQTIFHASFTCIKSGGRVNRESEMKKFDEQMTKDDFWQFVKNHYDRLSEKYDSVVIESVSMI